jgi:hypothetical protein
MTAQGYPGQPYGQQAAPYAYRQAPYAGGYPAAAGKRGSWVLGLLMLLAGGIVAGSTFLPWITTPSFSVPGYSGTASASTSGWSIMTAGTSLGGSSFNVVLTGEGAVFLTGFFSLLFGVLLLVAAVIIFFRRKIGGWLALFFAVGATACAAVDITMVFAKMSPLSPHVGLWAFAGAAITALVLSIVSLASG